MGREKTGSIKKAYELRSEAGAEATVRHYEEWAEDYDDDTASYGYVGPVSAAIVLGSYVPPDASVLDIGCGTGLAGEALVERGFSNIDGTDISPDMLEKARIKGTYQTLFVGDLVEGLEVDDAIYSAVITVGTFGPVGPEALRECLRVIKPGGFACISINELFIEEQDFIGEIHRIVEQGIAEFLEQKKHPHLTEGGHEAYIFILRIPS